MCKACAEEWQVWASTVSVREAKTPGMRQVREALEEKLIDVDASTIDYWSEDTDLIQGMVVTATRRVTLFDYDWLHGANSIVAWEEITDEPDKWYPPGHVEAANRILDSGEDPSFG